MGDHAGRRRRRLRIKFFSKRQEIFRAKAPSRKEKQVFFEVLIQNSKAVDSLCVLCGFARDSFSGLSGLGITKMSQNGSNVFIRHRTSAPARISNPGADTSCGSRGNNGAISGNPADGAGESTFSP